MALLSSETGGASTGRKAGFEEKHVGRHGRHGRHGRLGLTLEVLLVLYRGISRLAGDITVKQSISVAVKYSDSHTVRQSNIQTVTQSHSHTVTQSHSHTVARSHSHTVTQSHSHTVAQKVIWSFEKLAIMKRELSEIRSLFSKLEKQQL